MKIQYDPKVDAVYIDLAKGKYSISKKITESIVVDQDSKGKVLGIEILDATKNIPDFDPESISLNTVVL